MIQIIKHTKRFLYKVIVKEIDGTEKERWIQHYDEAYRIFEEEGVRMYAYDKNFGFPSKNGYNPNVLMYAK